MPTQKHSSLASLLLCCCCCHSAVNAHHHSTTAVVEQCGGVFCILNDLRAGGWTDDMDRGAGTEDGIPQFCCLTLQALLPILWPCIMRPVSSLSQNNQQFKSLITLCMTKTKSYKYRTTVKDDIKNYCWMRGFYSFYRLMHWGGESIVKSSFRLILVIVFL